MPYASIIQCDLCPAVTDDGRAFCKVEVTTVPPWSNRDEYRVQTAEAILCPECAEPVIAFQRMISSPAGGEEATERTKRLNDRILSAIQRTE